MLRFRHLREVGMLRKKKLSADSFNKLYQVGESVIYVEDDSSKTPTKLRSKAWVLGSGSPVVKVDGKVGGVSIHRILPR